MIIMANALMRKYGDYLLFFAEHHQPQVFHKDNIDWWQLYEEQSCHNKEGIGDNS